MRLTTLVEGIAMPETMKKPNYRDESCIVGVVTHDRGKISAVDLGEYLCLPNPVNVLQAPTLGQLLDGLKDNDARWNFVIDIKANIPMNAYYDLRTNDLDVITTLDLDDSYEPGFNMAMYDGDGDVVEVVDYQPNSLIKVDITDLKCFIIKERALNSLDSLSDDTTNRDICAQLREDGHIIYVDTNIRTTVIDDER